MTISNRAKVIIAGVLVIIAIILILLFLRRPSSSPTTTSTNKQTTTTQTKPTPTPTPKVTPVVTPEQKVQASLAAVAQIFTERYGSYSSESQAANLQDLLPLVTAGFRATLETQIATLQAASPAKVLYGVTTRFLSASVTSIDTASGTATLVVSTQQEETKGSVANVSIGYKKMDLTLKQVDGDWLVDSATWE